MIGPAILDDGRTTEQTADGYIAPYARKGSRVVVRAPPAAAWML
jgi:hypothetical protein